MIEDTEVLIWKLATRSVHVAKIAAIRAGPDGPLAVLHEPYGAEIGWFSLPELASSGRICCPEHVVFSAEHWASIDAAQEWSPSKESVAHQASPLESSFRIGLGLPIEGELDQPTIEHAFRVKVKTAHPDAGAGDNTQLRKLIEARNALIKGKK